MQRIGPITRKPNFHSKEKCLIGLVLFTLCLLCFGGIFLLPDNFGGERVLRVYKQIQEDGRDFLIPAPPLAAHASKEHHPHFVNDRKKLQDKIKQELGDLLENPQDYKELAAAAGDNSEQQRQLLAPDDGPQQGAAPPLNRDAVGKQTSNSDNAVAGMDNNNLPVGNVNVQLPLGGGADTNPGIDAKRQKVKEVCKIMFKRYIVYTGYAGTERLGIC